ncbi:MAG: sensor histidine kinase, partial [Solirubrobacterales bacterium]|nr:sensor histidine kinase [Solirubrobacterales bacterium]
MRSATGADAAAVAEAVARPPGTRTLWLAVASVAAAGTALCLVESVLVIAEPLGSPTWALLLPPLAAAAYLVAGAIAWARRPANRMGALIVAGGFVLLAAGLVNVAIPALTAVGLIFATVPLAVVVHLLHAFPSGRLRGRASRATVAAGYLVCTVMEAPRYLFAGGPDGPATVLRVAADPALVDRAEWVQLAAGACVMVATAAILARRWGAVPAQRRAGLTPLLAYGIGAVLFVPVGGKLGQSLLDGGDALLALAVAQLAVLAGVPVAFAVAVLRGGFAPTLAVEELAAWLALGAGRRPGPEAALAEALGDPSLELALWAPDRGGYVDVGGRPVGEPGAGSGRAAVEVAAEGRRIAAIAYDATLIGDPEPVRSAGQVVALALDNVRVTAALRASEESLRRSRERIVRAADGERRRIARDLHDGLQADLVLLAMRADALRGGAFADEQRADARAIHDGLQRTIDDVRQLVQGVMPALLAERGLVAAVEDLAERLPLPAAVEVDLDGLDVPAAVEGTVYLVVSEALANVVKHARATALDLTLGRDGDGICVEVRDDGVGGAAVDRGAGLRTMADRVDALGGRLAV